MSKKKWNRPDIAKSLEEFCRNEGLAFGLVVFTGEDGTSSYSLFADIADIELKESIGVSYGALARVSAETGFGE